MSLHTNNLQFCMSGYPSLLRPTLGLFSPVPEKVKITCLFFVKHLLPIVFPIEVVFARKVKTQGLQQHATPWRDIYI